MHINPDHCIAGGVARPVVDEGNGGVALAGGAGGREETENLWMPG